MTEPMTLAEYEAAQRRIVAECEQERRAAQRNPLPWRTGRKVLRTLYDANDELIGVMDSADLAARVVEAVNKERP